MINKEIALKDLGLDQQLLFSMDTLLSHGEKMMCNLVSKHMEADVQSQVVGEPVLGCHL